MTGVGSSKCKLLKLKVALCDDAKYSLSTLNLSSIEVFYVSGKYCLEEG